MYCWHSGLTKKNNKALSAAITGSGCPAKNILNFRMKIIFFKKSKIGHGGRTPNLIPPVTVIQ
jgi:hypothetical protein